MISIKILEGGGITLRYRIQERRQCIALASRREEVGVKSASEMRWENG